jgi:hypothetical protein
MWGIGGLDLGFQGRLEEGFDFLEDCRFLVVLRMSFENGSSPIKGYGLDG